MVEIWKDIPGYEGIYQASNLGRVKVLRRKRVQRSRYGNLYEAWTPERIMRQFKNSKTDHLWLLLVDKFGVAKRYGAHVLVLMTFTGEMPAGRFACHKNDIANDNALDNLYWGNRQTNGRDAVTNGKAIKANKHPATKLNEGDVVIIKVRLKNGESPTEIARDFPVGQACIRHIQTGRNWSHVKAETA